MALQALIAILSLTLISYPQKLHPACEIEGNVNP